MAHRKAWPLCLKYSTMISMDYSYHLPEELIASRPSVPRDAARLFVYDTAGDGVTFDTFAHLGDHLPSRSLLVFNDTKVVPARAELRKETGGKVEVLFLVNEWDRRGPIPAIADRKINVGSTLFFGVPRKGAGASPLSFTAVRQDENIFHLKPRCSVHEFFAILEKKGITPIPKYIKGTPLGEAALRKQYQAVFGRKPASAAAPTASLHFTERLLHRLFDGRIKTRDNDFTRTFVTLHVGLGTFAPVSEENLSQGTLHTESFSIPASARAAIRRHKAAGAPVVAVGTTVVRTLESQAAKILARGRIPLSGATDIFIRPPHHFRIADAMITNFHLPGTSLMMLVQAFLEDKGARRSVVDLYKTAIENRFRFYSFGDGMLIK